MRSAHWVSRPRYLLCRQVFDEYNFAIARFWMKESGLACGERGPSIGKGLSALSGNSDVIALPYWQASGQRGYASGKTLWPKAGQLQATGAIIDRPGHEAHELDRVLVVMVLI